VVEIDIAGITLRLVGVQIVRHSANLLECNPPAFRHGRSGEWLPAIILPPELADAIAIEVLKAFERDLKSENGQQLPSLTRQRR
jgi:hypothetical protein